MSDATSQPQPQPQPQPPGRDVAANMTENAEATRLKTNGPAVDDATTRVQTPHGVSGAAVPSRLPVPPLIPPPAPAATLPVPPTSTPAKDDDDDDNGSDDKAADATGIGIELMAADGTSVQAQYPPNVPLASDPFSAKAVTVQGRGAVGARATTTARHMPIAPPEIIDSASYATGVEPPVADDGESVMQARRGPGGPRARRSPGCLRQAVEMFWRPCAVVLVLILVVLIVAALTR